MAAYLVSAKQCSAVRVTSTNPTRIGAATLSESVLFFSEASTIKYVVFAAPVHSIEYEIKNISKDREDLLGVR